MRSNLVLVPLLLCATPALAQSADRQVPAELTDPAMADKLANAMRAMSDAFLNLPVGELQAAMQGREATAADRSKTVRSETRINEQELRRQIADAKPMIQHSMKTLATTLPAMMKSMEEVERAIARAAANMPDPTYPRQ